MSDWIPVKERLPDCDMNCLVSVDAHNFIGKFVTKARYVTDLTGRGLVKRKEE